MCKTAKDKKFSNRFFCWRLGGPISCRSHFFSFRALNKYFLIKKSQVSNPGLKGERREWYPCAIPPTRINTDIILSEYWTECFTFNIFCCFHSFASSSKILFAQKIRVHWKEAFRFPGKQKIEFLGPVLKNCFQFCNLNANFWPRTRSWESSSCFEKTSLMSKNCSKFGLGCTNWNYASSKCSIT